MLVLNLLDFIKQKMTEYGIEKYDIESYVLEVTASSNEKTGEANDFLLIGNYYTDSSVANGFIKSTDAALVLNAATQNSVFHKHQLFKGIVSVRNNDTANKLYVEFIKIVPIHCSK